MNTNSNISTPKEYYNNYQSINSSAQNLKNPFGNLLILSPLSPSNISYYQSPQNASDKLNYLPLKIENEGIESFNELNYYNNYSEEPQTPKMSINFENNSESFGKIEKTNEISDNNIQNKSTKEQTENVIIKDLKIENIIKKVPIANIVSTVDLGCQINLKQIALQVENTQYNPKKFTGLIMRLKEPKTTALIFPNGKLICLGAKTEEDSKKACKRFAKNIKNLDYPVSNVKNFKIQNIVGSCNVGFTIPLMKLYYHMKKYKCRVTYEPEIFPGLIYRYLGKEDKNDENGEQNLNIVFLIFASGKMVITGAKKINQIYDSFEKVFQLISKFKSKLDQKE